ncbi:hypothetical protein A3SI_02573 [Nitritalea halalkaliphila LW7]|uniref:VLRF1 domain-containing protein n=1 Tax=Nitritalea halalkaliphila LW7 TaxID=1189621 RepID=I5C9P7_9BACT|nr:hypothetical protein [Nitritalea halalkaliphila]EIM78549.1 hypothetical protein A3SI_02573 [Nitritalea halalkaliphila LW7]
MENAGGAVPAASSKRYALRGLSGQQRLAKLRPGIAQSWDGLELRQERDIHVAICYIQSGQALTAFYADDTLLDHKVFRAYMVRKKQGKSQLKHLKTKGKSRAGSRIRLAETQRFLREIHARMAEYEAEYRVDRIAFHCSALLLPHFFAQGASFVKEDPRIRLLDDTVEKPGFAFLTDIWAQARYPELRYFPAHADTLGLSGNGGSTKLLGENAVDALPATLQADAKEQKKSSSTSLDEEDEDW